MTAPDITHETDKDIGEEAALFTRPTVDPTDTSRGTSGEPADVDPQFYFASLPDFYALWLAPTIERRLDAAGTATLTWCPRWWEHPEVIARLEALWRAWEVCRHLDGEAPSRWFSQHCDPNLAILMDSKLGPMCDCSPTTHRRYSNASHLPGDPTPNGYWGSTDPAR